MSKKVSRRDFARTSVAAGAAVALPKALFAEAPAPAPPSVTTAAKGAEVARRRLAKIPPPCPHYGGDAASAIGEYRDSIAIAHDPAAAVDVQSPVTVGGWREGTTIPAEYYIDPKHFANDERFVAEHLWLLVDHENRIPKAGDYFVFEYGRGDSIIILRDKAGAVKGYHNVCRHRGSRLCRHDEDPAPKDARLTVKQLGSSGNTPVFRCPYHAWTYDLEGKLISAPNGMPPSFEMSSIGLAPCHVRTVEGFIFANLSHDKTPPDFDDVVKNFAAVAKEYGTADLVIGARASAPTRANWKLVLENFQECYHCAPAHRHLVTTHPFWDGMMANEQRTRLMNQVEKFIPPDRLARARGQSGAGGGMAQPGGGLGGDILNVNFVSGTIDGKAAAPLLPTRPEWTHRSRLTSTAWSTGYLQCYDDHVACVRFTPRDVDLTDAELFWLVKPGLKEGKDYQAAQLRGLWEVTYKEDRWIVENNHQGIASGSYQAGVYAAVETGPSRFIKWYMTEVVPSRARQTDVG